MTASATVYLSENGLNTVVQVDGLDDAPHVVRYRTRPRGVTGQFSARGKKTIHEIPDVVDREMVIDVDSGDPVRVDVPADAFKPTHGNTVTLVVPERPAEPEEPEAPEPHYADTPRDRDGEPLPDAFADADNTADNTAPEIDEAAGGDGSDDGTVEGDVASPDEVSEEPEA